MNCLLAATTVGVDIVVRDIVVSLITWGSVVTVFCIVCNLVHKLLKDKP